MRIDREMTAGSDYRWSLSRRSFLRGVGTCVALPAFECMTGSGAEAGEMLAPRRMACVSIPNGVRQDAWWPSGAGPDFQLSKTIGALEKVKHQIQVFQGLDHVNAEAGADGPGDHARANATLLTGVRA